MKTIKIKTKFGRFLTVNVKEQTEDYISGTDKFGTFVKIKISDIESCEPTGGEFYG